MKIGAHVSMSKGLLGASKEAAEYGANTFMIYTGAPQNTRRSPIEKLKIPEGMKHMEQNGITDIVVHAPYIINLASFKEATYKLATDFLKIEIERTEALGSKYLVLHPGAFTETNLEYGIQRIADGINSIITEETNVIICLETMVGKGSEIGSKFEELKQIIDKIELKERIGVCIDTCHLHDAGYDIINDFDGVMEHFDEVIGLERLKVVHINGSLNPCGARKDRHANIGAGEDNPKGKDYLGVDALYNIANSKYTKDAILILETPWLDEKTNLYKEEIALLRGEGKL